MIKNQSFSDIENEPSLQLFDCILYLPFHNLILAHVQGLESSYFLPPTDLLARFFGQFIAAYHKCLQIYVVF